LGQPYCLTLCSICFQPETVGDKTGSTIISLNSFVIKTFYLVEKRKTPFMMIETKETLLD
jgi:hypothetical protein